MDTTRHRTLFLALLLIAGTSALLSAFPVSARDVVAAAGTGAGLDPTFGNGGIVAIQGLELVQVTGGGVQADGKIVLVGSTSTDDFGVLRGAIARFRSDGSLDATFGNAGVVTFGIPNGYKTYPRTVTFQHNGKIVVAGEAQVPDAQYFNWFLSRFLPDGSPDPTFGTGGSTVIDFGLYTRILAVDVQTDDRIVAGGYTDRWWTVGRFTVNGRLDTTYGDRGFATTTIPGPTFGAVRRLVVEPNGRVLALGNDAATNVLDFYVTRYTVSGAPDLSLGSDSLVQTDTASCNPDGSGYDWGRALATLPDGRFLVGGNTTAACDSGLFDWLTLARYGSDGALDPTFGEGGIAKAAVHNGWIVGLASEADGAVLAGAFTYRAPVNAFTLARFLADGRLDEGFGTGGLLTTSFGETMAEAIDLLTQPDGKVVLIGTVADGVGMIRYETHAILPFDAVLQDDATHAKLLFNSATGAFRLEQCGSPAVTGTGTVERIGRCAWKLHVSGPVSLEATVSFCRRKGHAIVRDAAGTRTLKMKDSDTTDDISPCR